MFDRIFTRPTVRARHRDGPLLQERLAYLSQLADHGASPRNLRRAACSLLTVIKYLCPSDQPSDSVHPDQIGMAADRWASRRCKAINRRAGSSSRPTFVAIATGWLRFLGRLVEPAPVTGPFDAMIETFTEHLRGERGHSFQTIRNRRWVLHRFLDQLGTEDSLHSLTITRFDELFLKMVDTNHHSRVSVRHYAGTLRAFFRYAEIRGWCRSGLGAAIHGPRVYSQTAVPKGPTWDEVKRLLADTEGDRPVDIRARAILLLLAVYGLRSGEVVKLQLSDLDWEQERILVASPKNSHARTYPLNRIVGDAIIRYLKVVRPRSTHRTVFLTMTIPPRPLRELWAVVAPRLRRLGVSIPHHGPHALRHACATHLLAEGLSLKAIGDHLGHRDPDSTRVYAKVDLVGLRQVADFDLEGLQ